MTAQFYINTSPTDTLDKNITAISPVITVVPYDATSITRPVLILDYNSDYIDANYIKITWDNGMSYYYYCTVATNNGGQLIVTCERDPLMCFKDAIKNCDITVTRNAGIGAPTIYPDSKLPVYPTKKNITSIVMPETSSSFTGDGETCYLLTCIGGEPTE